MLPWLVQNTITAALLAALVAAGCRLFRFRPAVAHALWLVVLVKLLTPPLVYWPWPMPDWSLGPAAVQPNVTPAPPAVAQPTALPEVPRDLQSTHSASPPATSIDASPWVEFDLAWQRPDSAPQVRAIERERVAPAPVTDASPSRGLGSDALLRWLITLWSAATLAVVALQLHRIGRLWRMACGAPPSPELRAALTRIAARLDVRAPRVVVTRLANAPLLVALFRPKLLWPAGLERQLPAAALEGVLAHELAHLRRRDHWVGWLELAAACLWWWNPLFWYVRHRLREAAELACDAWVVHALPGGRRSYAEALIEVCRFVSRPVPPLPAVGMGNPARRSLERRLTMILRDRVPCRVPLAGFAAIALLWLAALPAWSTGQEADPPATDPAVTPADAPDSDDATPITLPDRTPGDDSAAENATPVPQASPAQPGTQNADRADPFVAPGVENAMDPTGPVGQSAPGVAVPSGEVPWGGPDFGMGDESTEANPQQRLDRLESQLERLLQEVRRLRDPGPAASVGQPMPAPRFPSTPPILAPSRSLQRVPGAGQPPAATLLPAAPASSTPATADRPPRAAATPAPANVPSAQDPAFWPRRAASANVSVQTLSRARYRLPEAKATALAQLLSEHAGDVETKVDGDTLIVTATPKAQQIIGQFIALLAAEQFLYEYPSPGEASALGSLGFRPPSPPRRRDVFDLRNVRGTGISFTIAVGERQGFDVPAGWIWTYANPQDNEFVQMESDSATRLWLRAEQPGTAKLIAKDRDDQLSFTLDVVVIPREPTAEPVRF